MSDRGPRILRDSDEQAGRLRRERARAGLTPADTAALARLYAPAALGAALSRCEHFMGRAAAIRAGESTVRDAARPYAGAPSRRDVIARYLFVAAWPHRFHTGTRPPETDVLARLLLPNIAAGGWNADADPGPEARRRWIKADRRAAIVRAAGWIAADGAGRCRSCGCLLTSGRYCKTHERASFQPRDDSALLIVFDGARAGIEDAGAAWRSRWQRAGWPLGRPLPDAPAGRQAA